MGRHSAPGHWRQRLQRPIALIASVTLVAVGLVVGVGLPQASAAPAISIAADVPNDVISDTDIPIALTASNPAGSPGEDVYNLSFNYALPAGVTYVAGSSTIDLGRGGVASADPEIVPIMVPGPLPGDPPVLDHFVLVWTNVSDLVAGSDATLSFTTHPDPAVFIVGTSVPSGGHAGAYASTDPRDVPDFDPVTGMATGGFDSSDVDTDPGATQISAISVTKSPGDVPEGELIRGVHDHVTTYSISVLVTEQPGGIAPLTVVDWLPANLEFLGCGGVDNSTVVTEEYPGSGPLGQAAGVPSCILPSAVETELVTTPIPGGPSSPGVYTKVTWNLSGVAAGSVTTIRYQAAVPLFENTVDWDSATVPTPVSLEQGSNLDNNNGASTREPAGGPDGAQNFVLASGIFGGAVDPNASTTQTASTSNTVTVHDLAVQKSLVSPSHFTPGQNATFDLVLRTSEYTTAEDLSLGDLLPSGMCPMTPVGFADYPTDAPAQCRDNHADVVNATVDSVAFDAPTGEFDMTLVPDGSSLPDTRFGTSGGGVGSLGVNAVLTVRYQARMLADYLNTSDPTVAGDSFGNAVLLSGTTIDPDGVEVDVENDSAASIGTNVATINKLVAVRPTTTPAAAIDCTTTAAADWVSGPSTPATTFQQGDTVCFKLVVDFSDTVVTRNAQIQDFIPDSLVWSVGNWAVGPGFLDPVVLATPTSATAPTFLIGTEDANGDGDRYTRSGSTLELFLWGTVDTTAPTGVADLDGNLMKYREIDTEGRVTALRDDVAFTTQPAIMTLEKSASTTAIQAGTVVTYTVPIVNATTAPTSAGPVALPFDVEDIRVWDALPVGFTCADVVVPPGPYTATCVLPASLAGYTGPAAGGVIVWSIPGPIASGAGLSLSYDVTVPTGLGVALDFTNTASIVSFTSPNTGGADSAYYPTSPLFTPPSPAVNNTPSATDTATVRTGDLAIAKTAVPADTFATSGQAPGFDTATDTVRGQRVTYAYSVTVPAGATAFHGVLSDVLPTGILSTGATISATFPGGSVAAGGSSGGFSLSASGTLTFPTSYTNPSSTVPAVITVTVEDALVSPTTPFPASPSTNTATFASRSLETGGAARSVTSNAAITVKQPAITVSKSASPSTAVGIGTDVTYTLGLSSTGAAAAFDTVIVDCLPDTMTYLDHGTLPTGVTFAGPVAGTGASAPGNGCAVGTQLLTWTWGPDVLLPPTTTLTFTAEPNSGVASTSVTNTVRATASSLPTGGNDAAIEQVVASNASTSITLATAASTKIVTAPVTSPTVAYVTNGETISYRATVTLQPGLAYPRLAIRDTLPANTALVGAMAFVGCVDSASADCAADITGTPSMLTASGQTVALYLGNLAADPLARTITVEYTVAVSSSATITRNTALTNSVRASWRLATDAVPTSAANGQFAYNGTATTVTSRVKLPRLTLGKVSRTAADTANLDVAKPGDTVLYAISVANPAASPAATGSTAHNVVIVDTVPVGLIVDAASISNGGTAVVNVDGTTTITWNIASIATGAAATRLTYTVTLSNSALLTGTTRTNSVTADYATLATGGRQMPRVSTSDAVTLQFPNVTLAKALANPAGSATAGPSYIGDTATWTLTLTNGGTAPAATVTPTDTLPPNWEFVSSTLRIGSGSTATFTPTSTAGGVIEWPAIAGLAPATAAVITLVARPTAAVISSPGVGNSILHTNSLSAVTTDANGATGNGTGTYTGPAATASTRIDSADVRVAKTQVATGTLVAGTTGTAWAVVVSNAGPDTAVGPFVVTDTLGTLPTGVTAGTPTGTGWTCATASAPASFTCSRTTASDTLASGASFPTISVPLTIAADVVDGTQVDNAVTVAARTYDPTTANNSSSATVTIVARAALRVDKVANGPFVAGGTASWTVDTTNLGPSLARYPITVTDSLPSGIGTVTIVAGAGWDCPATAAAGSSFTCTFEGTPGDGLAVGAALPQIGLSAPILPDTTGSLSNTAEAASATTRPVRADTPWIDTTTTPVSDETALTITKSLVSAKIVPGESAVYEFTVTNNGTPTARDVSFTDALPSGLTFASLSVADGWDCSDTAVGATTIDCEYGPLAGTGSASDNVTTFRVEVDVASSVTGTIANTGRVAWANGPGGIAGSATGSTTTGATVEVDLQMVKTQSATPVTAGAAHTYTLTVTNNGPSDAPIGAAVTDALPAGMTIDSFVAPAGWTCAATDLATDFECESTAILQASATAVFTVVVIVDAALPATTPTNPAPSNTATVTTPTGVVDTDPSNDSSTVDTSITTSADVTIDKTAAATFVPGEDVVFTLTIVNAGPSVARTASVTDTLPAGLTLVSMVDGVGGAAWDCPTTPTGSCTIAQLPVGTSTVIVTASSLASITSGTALVNDAVVEWSDATSASPRTDEDDATVTAAPVADLTVAKATTTPELVGGETASFTLTVSNAGPSDQPAGAVVVDTLPVGMRFVAAGSGGTDWSCTAATVPDTDPQPVDCTFGAIIVSGATTPTLTIIATTDPTLGLTATTTLVNSAVVAWTDASGAQTSDPATADVVFGSLADVTIEKTHVDAEVRVGDEFDFTITVSNDGPSSATGITVTDTLPAGLAFVSGGTGAWTCTESTTTVGLIECSTTEIVAPGASAAALTITVETLAAAYPEVTNTASVVASNDQTADETTDPVTVPPLVDLQPTKTVVGEVRLGGTATFQLDVVNDGPTEVPFDAIAGTGGFTLVDTLPTGLTYTGFTSTDPTVDCTAAGQVVTCDFARALAVSASTSVTIVADVLPTAAPSLTNVVVAAPEDGVEQVPGDHSDSVDVTVVTPQPLLELTKTALAGGVETATAAPGDSFEYRIDITPAATSDGTAHHVVVTDTVPAVFDVDVASVTASGGTVVAGGAGSPTQLQWTLADIADDATATTIGFTVTLARPALVDGTPIANTATVDWDNLATGATVSGTDSDDATIQPLLPRVTVAKALASATPSSIGVPASWTITLVNTGGATARDIVVTDVLPTNWTAGAAMIAVDGAPGSPIGTTTSGDPQVTIVVEAFDLAAGSTAIITVAATPTAAVVDDPGVGSAVAHVNSVSAVVEDATGATGSGTPTTPYAGPATTAQTRIDSADVTIAKSAIADVPAGLTTAAAWTITVGNDGDDTAVGPFTVTDALDASGDPGITMDAPTGSGWSCTLAPDARSFSCERTDAGDVLAPDAAFPDITVPVVVAPGVAIDTAIENTATVTASTYDPDDTNNTADAELTVTEAEASLTLVKTANAPFNAGQTATWDLDVTNTGPAIARWPVTITDTLPAGIGAATGTGGDADGTWVCTQTGGELVCAFTGAGDGLAVDGSLPALEVSATVLSGTTANLANRAEAASATAFPPVTPGTEPWIDSTDTPVGDDTTLSVQKDAVGEVIPGSNAVFDITVTNTGTPDARDVALSDPLPVGMTFVSVDAASVAAGWDCSATAAGDTTVDCALAGPLPGSANTPAANASTLTVTVAVPATVTATIINTATATWANCATGDCLTTGSWTDDPSIQSDLSVLKSAPASVLAGEGFDYTFVVRNDGPSQVGAGVVLSDVVPAPFIVTAVTAPTTGWVCDIADPITNDVSCTSTDVMAPEAEVEFSVTVVVPDSAAASPGIQNTATVAVPAGTVDPDTANNTSSATTAIATLADVTIDKSGPTSAAPGTGIVYTLEITNVGPSIARSATVADTPPAGVTITGMTDADGDAVAWNCPSGTTGPWLCTVAELPVGTSTVTVTASIASSVPDATVLTNTGTVSWTDSQSGSPHSDVDTHDTTAVTDSTIALEKSTSTPSIAAGEQARFTLTLSNTGPSDLVAGATITETLPAGLTYVSHASTGSVWTLTDDTVPLVFTLADGVPTGGTAPVLELVTATDPSLGTPIEESRTNVATATWTDGTGGGTTPDATANVEIGSRSAVTATKAHDPAAVRVGDPLDFVITVDNAGPSSAVGVTVREQLPEQLEWVGIAAGVSPDWSCTPDAGDATIIECAYAQPVAPTLSAPPLTITVLVTADAYPAVTNTIVAGAGNDPSDPVAATDEVIVPALVNLVPTKEIIGQLVAGDDARFAITVTNEGPTPTVAFDESTGLGGFTITDMLPTGMTFVRSIGDGVVCEATGQAVECLVDGVLDVEETIAFELVAAIASDVRGEIENVVVVTTDAEQTDTDPDAHTARAAGVVLPPPPLPWTGQAGGQVGLTAVLALLVLLAGAGILVCRRAGTGH